jgi:hypothetical protein
MDAAEAERLLRPVALGVEPGGGGPGAGGGGEGEPTYAGSGARRPRRPRRAARRRWPWIVGTVSLALLLAATAILVDAARRPRGAAGPPAPTEVIDVPRSPSPTGPAPTAAARVQACTVAAPDREVAVTAGSRTLPGAIALLDGWVYHRDEAGFRIGVPLRWRMFRLDGLLCLRDPTSRRAIAVFDHGRVTGDPADLLLTAEPAWRAAAGLRAYARLGVTDLRFTEGAADLEYTYEAPDGVPMHGVNRMVRMDGRVFTIYWLTTHATWLSDRVLMNHVQPSFGLEPAGGHV